MVQTRITREHQIRLLEASGAIVRDCPTCQEFYRAEHPVDVFAPRHTASPTCESGQRPHCTCDTCF